MNELLGGAAESLWTETPAPQQHHREPFGPLTGTLVPPFVSHVVAILEGLLALEQGVKCITLGYGQAGNVAQDIAALRSLRRLAHHYFLNAGYGDYVTPV